MEAAKAQNLAVEPQEKKQALENTGCECLNWSHLMNTVTNLSIQ
jgi:hypothetical protein